MEAYVGILRKSIDLHEAPIGRLEAQLGLRPNLRDYAASQLAARWEALDGVLHLDSDVSDIWEQRAKSLIQRIYGVSRTEKDWWGRLVCCLAACHVPGFSIKDPNKRKHGAPRQWTDIRLAELLADVEFLKRTTRFNVQAICKKLPRAQDYAHRYGDHSPEALRKQYSLAKRASGQLLWTVAAIEPEGDAVESLIKLHALQLPLKTKSQNLRK